MIRFAAFAALVAVLATASFVWADDKQTGSPAAGKGSVSSTDIRDGTIRLRDLQGRVRRMVTRPGPRGENGQDGFDGLDGLDGFDGLDGLDGRDGVSGYAVATLTTPPSAEATLTTEVDCTTGTSVLGGGVVPTSADPAAAFDVVETRPQDDNSGWRGRVTRTAGAGDWTLEVRAFCADVTP